MSEITLQMREWAGGFGRDYANRNALTLEDMNQLYRERYGITRTEMNQESLGDFDRTVRILEVGSNIGNQLLCLQQEGFVNLYRYLNEDKVDVMFLLKRRNGE